MGWRCRTLTIKDVLEETRLDWQTIKDLDAQYMQEQLRRAGKPAPKVVGVDEISIRKGHTYRIVVSDLERRRPIWFGGNDRSEASMDMFYQWLGSMKIKQIRLVVMDMWKPFRASTLKAEHAAILFDKFHGTLKRGWEFNSLLGKESQSLRLFRAGTGLSAVVPPTL